MTAEEIARKHEFKRREFTLSGYEEVGLPFYRIRLRAYTLDRKPIPPVEEFVLKSVSAGLSSPDDLAGFLGLHDRVIASSVSNLIRSEDVHFGASDGDRRHALRLTTKGRQTLEEASLVVPQQGTFEVDFDGLLRTVTSYRKDVEYTPKELRESGLLEIDAHPVRPPELRDLDFQQVARQVSQTSQRGKRELISITALEKRLRLFRPAVALVYRSTHDERIEVSFVVNGRPSTDYELAFAGAGGPEKLGMNTVPRPLVPAALGLSAVEVAGAPDPVAVETVRERVATAREAIDEAHEQINRSSTVSELAQAKEQLREVEQKYEEARAALEAFDIQYLKVFDHPPLLEEALTQARERLLIICPFVAASVVNDGFLKKISTLCANGVKVYIGYGIGDDPRRQANKWDVEAERKLQRLGGTISNLAVRNFGNTHAKILAYDRKFAVLGSFNWLSFKGSRERGYRDEQGILLRIPSKVDEKFDEELVRFDSVPPA